MEILEKIHLLKSINCKMNNSKLLCIDDAVTLIKKCKIELANKRLEKAAQYVFGFHRPKNWYKNA